MVTGRHVTDAEQRRMTDQKTTLTERGGSRPDGRAGSDREVSGDVPGPSALPRPVSAANHTAADQHAEAALEAHGHAMTALAADVHPYSSGAARDREAELAHHIEALRVRAAAADQLARALRETEVHAAGLRIGWPDIPRDLRKSLYRISDRARAALAAFDAATRNDT